jgi:hypothetical protein
MVALTQLGTVERTIVTTGRIVFGLAWALSLAIGGGYLIQAGPDYVDRLARTGPLPYAIPAVITAGIAAVVAGHFIFMVVVADRVFPAASPRTVAILEWLTAGALVLLVALTAAFAAVSLMA